MIDFNDMSTCFSFILLRSLYDYIFVEISGTQLNSSVWYRRLTWKCF